MVKTNLFLYGASGHSKVIIDILESCNLNLDGYYDDNLMLNFFNGYEVFHDIKLINKPSNNLIISIGNNLIRKSISKKLLVNYINAIHSTAYVSSTVQIGVGTVVMPNASINSNSLIGEHAIINTNSSVDHDCKVGDFVHISPNVALTGNVEVGEGTHIGIGASIIQGVRIGKWVTIGAGSVIIKDVPDYAVVVGNPGKIIKYNTINEL